MSIEERFDISFVSRIALREKAIQQNYRPIIAVHKWFARRPGSLFRGLILSEFVDQPLAASYFRSHDLAGIRIADPFMGGGTPLLEANRLGAHVHGWDINPMAWWIVKREMEHLDLDAYKAAAGQLVSRLENEIGEQYRTQCTKCGDPAHVKCFLWVKTQQCSFCRSVIDLFPGYLVAKNVRHPSNVLVCAACGDLNEVSSLKDPGRCIGCERVLVETGPARRGTVECPDCRRQNTFPDPEGGCPDHRMFAIEYFCLRCKPRHRGRFFKRPDTQDFLRYGEAQAKWHATESRFVPDDLIPGGDESTRLHRWGYANYRQLFNKRQLLGLELSCQFISERTRGAVRNALATNLSDLLRYNNMLVRYDTVALKALDAFSVHGFPVGLVRCESNLLGVRGSKGEAVGSGGWINMVDKYTTAKDFCARPFEVRAGSRTRVYTSAEWIGDRRNGDTVREVDIRCGPSRDADLPAGSLDGVFTDPPYFDSVQYAELMDFCYVWLRRLVGNEANCFSQQSTRNSDELTGNATQGRDLDHFTEGLSAVFQRMAEALKPGAPLVFTYHHNRIQAYLPIATAILDANLTCTAALPCPAEMGGSIHISGTGSSIVDTVFVCRDRNSVSNQPLDLSAEGLAEIVSQDLKQLQAGGVTPTEGDTRCVVYGHLTRLAILKLQDHWVRGLAVAEKLNGVLKTIQGLAPPEEVWKNMVQDQLAALGGGQPDLFSDVAEDGKRRTVPLRGHLRGVGS